jgi:hypothetical protein
LTIDDTATNVVPQGDHSYPQKETEALAVGHTRGLLGRESVYGAFSLKHHPLIPDTATPIFLHLNLFLTSRQVQNEVLFVDMESNSPRLISLSLPPPKMPVVYRIIISGVTLCLNGIHLSRSDPSSLSLVAFASLSFIFCSPGCVLLLYFPYICPRLFSFNSLVSPSRILAEVQFITGLTMASPLKFIGVGGNL